MSDQFVAEIRIFGFNFPPTGWAFCNGQVMPIAQNTALFSLLGTTYGGDGKSTFALPDLKGRAPMNAGEGAGLSQHFLGEQGGSESVTLLESEMPSHSHALRAATQDNGDVNIVSPTASYAPSTGGTLYQTAASAASHLAPQAIGPFGGSQPHNNMQPYLALNFCIALQGMFPPRS